MVKPRPPRFVWGVLINDQLDCFATRKEAREIAREIAAGQILQPASVHQYELIDPKEKTIGGLSK